MYVRSRIQLVMQLRGRRESTCISNAGADLKRHSATPICPNLHLGRRVVRLDQPHEFGRHFIRRHYPQLGVPAHEIERRSKIIEAHSSRLLEAQTLLQCAT